MPTGRFFVDAVDVEEMADLLAWKGVTDVTLTPVTVGLENGRTEVSVRGDVTQVFCAARLLEVDLDDVEVY